MGVFQRDYGAAASSPAILQVPRGLKVAERAACGILGDSDSSGDI